jgi:hypothetical protein
MGETLIEAIFRVCEEFAAPRVAGKVGDEDFLCRADDFAEVILPLVAAARRSLAESHEPREVTDP